MTTFSIADAKAKGMIVGKNVVWTDTPNFGSEPYLIEIGDNTTVSFDVAFVTHDAAVSVARHICNKPDIDLMGVIKIGKNCFVGCRSVILRGVEIGDNTIIGAGSVVNKSIPSNCVAAGVPCKVICTIDEYIAKHKDEFLSTKSLSWEEKKKYLLNHFYGDNK